MNENMKSSQKYGTEGTGMVASSEPQQAPETPAFEQPGVATGSKGSLPPSRNTKMIALVAVVAVVLIAVIATLSSGLFSNPEKDVKNAITATMDMMEKRNEKMKKELPAYNMMTTTETGARKSHVDLRFTSLEGDFPTDVNMMAKLFEGIGLQGDFVSDPESNALEMNLGLAMQGTNMIDLYAFFSPELIAGNVPAFSEKVISINPQTLPDDIRNHPTFSLIFSEEDLKEIEEAFASQSGLMGAAWQLDVKKMNDDMMAIIKKNMQNATYERAGKEGSNKLYTVTIPGADMKNCLRDLVQYIYVDSELGALYQDIMPVEAGWNELVQNILSFIDKDVSDLPTVVNFAINKTVQSAHMEITPNSDERLTVDYTIKGQGDEEVVFSLISNDAEYPAQLDFSIKDSYTDGKYTIDFGVDFAADEGESFTFVESLSMDKNNAYLLDMGITLTEPIVSGEFHFTVDGTITQDGEKIVSNFPKILASAKFDTDEFYQINFSLDTTSEPIASPYTISKEHTNLFSMSEADLAAEVEKYEKNAQLFVQDILMRMFGGGGMGGTPELPAA
ncbi:MAG: hypothetical protein HFG20_03620 [Anaerotruncus sp.]|nr:hypothetical protein [Anaerotruncus sp.]